ncbi:MAG TPA: hypothetical protein VGA56_19840 [Opitutaceae bacterium]
MASFHSIAGFHLVTGAVVIVGSAAAMISGCAADASRTTSSESAAERARSQAAFVEIAAVLRHPRCINCHTVTDFPRQGDAGRRHAQFVLRGPDNHGVPAMRCNSCHQDSNQENGVPGAPHWALAPLSMSWEGLDDNQLAEALKDESKNGGRSLESLLDHMAHDPLVLWGWNPGGTREPVPVPHETFVRRLEEWMATGAVSPEPSP